MPYCKSCLEKGMTPNAYKPNGKGQAQKAPEGEECFDCYMDSICSDLSIEKKQIYLKQEIGQNQRY